MKALRCLLVFLLVLSMLPVFAGDKKSMIPLPGPTSVSDLKLLPLS
jgi:hypothetical protein